MKLARINLALFAVFSDHNRVNHLIVWELIFDLGAEPVPHSIFKGGHLRVVAEFVGRAFINFVFRFEGRVVFVVELEFLVGEFDFG